MANTTNQNSALTDSPDQGKIISKDFVASIVVFLVALPLCMGIAIASGVPVASGLITGIVGGIVVGVITGAPLQVSGPAAGLTVIVYDLVQKHGLTVLGVAVLVGGMFQLIAGLFKLGQWFRAVSPSVIYGMLAGIGVLIFSSQFHVMVDDKPKGGGIKNLITIPQAIWKGIGRPELGTTGTRIARTELLKEMGALHEQQVQIHEHVEETIDPTVDKPALEDKTIEELIAEQETITAGLQHAIAKLETVESEPGRGKIPQALPEAKKALEASQQAVKALQGDSTDAILASQKEIENQLVKARDSMKSHNLAALVGLVTLIILIGWNFVPKKLKIVPGALIAVVIVTVFVVLLSLPVLYVEIPNNIWSEIHFPTWNVISTMPLGIVFQAGIVLALVASAETLLCATAVTKMKPTAHVNYDQELAAQGVGNMVCGCLGALPMTGVIVRSATNVQAGGETKLSTILHGIWLLVFVSFLGFVLGMIPTSALAAILVYTGYKLVNPKAVKELAKYGKSEVAIYLATVICIVSFDLLTGVIIGFVLSAMKLLIRLHLDVELEKGEGNAVTVYLKGSATFLRLPILAAELDGVEPDAEVNFNFDELDYIDQACLEQLNTWADQHRARGGTVDFDLNVVQAQFYRKPQPESAA